MGKRYGTIWSRGTVHVPAVAFDGGGSSRGKSTIRGVPVEGRARARSIFGDVIASACTPFGCTRVVIEPTGRVALMRVEHRRG